MEKLWVLKNSQLLGNRNTTGIPGKARREQKEQLACRQNQRWLPRSSVYLALWDELVNKSERIPSVETVCKGPKITRAGDQVGLQLCLSPSCHVAVVEWTEQLQRSERCPGYGWWTTESLGPVGRQNVNRRLGDISGV
jgi:hypothetical protein